MKEGKMIEKVVIKNVKFESSWANGKLKECVAGVSLLSRDNGSLRGISQALTIKEVKQINEWSRKIIEREENE